MRLSSLKRFVAVLLLLILVQAFIACGGDEQGAESPFRIGVMESLTGAGETYGTVAVQAKKMAADEIDRFRREITERTGDRSKATHTALQYNIKGV